MTGKLSAMSVHVPMFPQLSGQAAGIRPFPIACPALVVVVLVIVLSAALVWSGVAPSAAIGTVSGAGLAAVEVLRRFSRAAAQEQS